MADTESSTTGGTKRKLKENAFTAKAESGTLKVKILRRDQQPVDTVVDNLSSSGTSTTKTKSRRVSKQQPASNSPPKPRPNRKHVPIFYDTQFRQPIKRGASNHSHSSSTDESQSTSSTGVPGIHSTSSTEVSGAATASTSSTSSSFVSQLSDVRLQGDVGPPPKANPLFARKDRDGLGTLGELLRPYMPSGSAGLQPSFPLGGGTTSSAGLIMDQTTGLSSALHQLASSSASYRSALDALLTATNGITSTAAAASCAVVDVSTTTSDTAHDEANGGLESYRFDPFSALQTAIDHARRASLSTGNTNQHSETNREVGSPTSNARFYRLEPSETTHSNEGTSTSLGPPPELPPAFTLQNSLAGGGIQRLTSLKSTESNDKDSTSSPSNDESGAKDAIAALGPPPDAPPSFLLSNSLTGGGISMLNLSKTNPSLDRLGSLTRLISQANEEAKSVSKTLTSPPKTNLNLRRLVSSVSVTSDDGETVRGMNLTATSAPDASSASSSTTHETESSSNGAMGLGPPPTGPPAFTIGNSLMGGGIELQPAAANVNTHNFDWKLYRSASNSGGDVNSTPAATGLSHGLRARLERTLASSQKGTDKS